MNIFKYFTGNSASDEHKEQALNDVKRHIEKHGVGSPSHTTRRIVRQAEIFRRITEYLKVKAPYYPQYEFFKQSELLPRILGPREDKEELHKETFYVTTKVRHLHEGTWYARHHVQTYSISEVELNQIKDKAWAEERVRRQLLQQLTHSTYLDLKFGQINPDFERPGGGQLDPIDNIQVSEEERLNLK